MAKQSFNRSTLLALVLASMNAVSKPDIMLAAEESVMNMRIAEAKAADKETTPEDRKRWLQRRRLEWMTVLVLDAICEVNLRLELLNEAQEAYGLDEKTQGESS